jgi:hypothetical protein
VTAIGVGALDFDAACTRGLIAETDMSSKRRVLTLWQYQFE